MRYGKFFIFLGFSASAFLGSVLTALSQDSDSKSQEHEQPRPPLEVRLVPPEPPASGGGCFSGLRDRTTFEAALKESSCITIGMR